MTSIVFENVTFSYIATVPMFQELTVRLDGPSDGHRGHVIAIMGPSGSGKTTLLRLICDVERPLRGRLKLLPDAANVSYLPQQPVLFEHLSRLDNARYFATVQHTRGRFDEATFQRLAAKLKLTQVIDSQNGTEEMSGGERQRLSLLRALSVRPDILLLDEPCTGLDTDVKFEFLHMLREVVDDLKLLTLYVTHHANEADLVADEMLYLSHEGTTSRVTTRLLSIQMAVSSPPSPEAALGSMGSGGNIVACTVSETGTITSVSEAVLGRIVDSRVPSGQYIVVFPPETVEWNADVDRGVRRVGQSARFSFAVAPETDKLIGPCSPVAPKSFSLHGHAVVFRLGESPGVRVTIMGEDNTTKAR